MSRVYHYYTTVGPQGVLLTMNGKLCVFTAGGFLIINSDQSGTDVELFVLAEANRDKTCF